MNKEVKLVFEDGRIEQVSRGTTVYEVLDKLNNNQVVGLRVNGKAVDTNYEIMSDAHIKLLDIDDRIGRKIYMKGLQFLYLKAVFELFGDYTSVQIKHSLDKAIYTEITGRTINTEVVKQIKNKMKDIVKLDLPIKKLNSSTEDVLNYVDKMNEREKVLNYTYMTNDYVSIFELGDIYNYFYYIMPASTAILNRFDLTYVEPRGIVLSYPIDGVVPKYNPSPKVLESFKKYEKQLDKLGIEYASDINRIVSEGDIRETIATNEILYDESLNDIARKVANNSKIKAIFMSGPSSSGKTTSSKRLALCLKAKGIDTLVISTDDYYLEREETPMDENGKRDYEVVEALDYKLFSTHLRKLLKGDEVSMPTFNFITGEKEYKRKPIKLHDHEVLIVEGLHAINEKLNGSIDRQCKIKIYLSPFTPISLDRHNHISTTDIRLIRRMVRDYKTRGCTAEATFTKWLEMRKSEEKNVYPYQREADIILNTSLAYEIGVLRTYVEPLLYSIKPDSAVYEEAKRTLNFLKGFLNIPGEMVPNTSVLREFIGGSAFE